ncbi:tRNA pseudouridine(38-40) synthase TruA [Salinivirga cyanobacteriivorans]
MRYFINLAYDGTHYHGWQIQPNAISVQQIANDAIGKITREQVNVVGCGRTDTGVHASYFVLHVDMHNAIIDVDKFTYHLNAVLPKDIVAYETRPVSNDLHARFSATAREYHYFLSKTPHPYLYPFTKPLVKRPDIQDLHKAAKIIGQNTDFASFCKAHAANKTNICHITESEWIETNDLLVYRIKADRFLRNMVRALVGTMLEIGYGKRPVENLQQIFNDKSRSKAGMSAAPEGLFLTGVWYPDEIFEQSSRLPFPVQ